ncbi:hypothetical protein [Streptomyces goshikiensis]
MNMFDIGRTCRSARCVGLLVGIAGAAALWLLRRLDLGEVPA